MADRIVLSKMELHSETVRDTHSLTIFKDFQWFVSYFGHKVPGFASLLYPAQLTLFHFLMNVSHVLAIPTRSTSA